MTEHIDKPIYVPDDVFFARRVLDRMQDELISRGVVPDGSAWDSAFWATSDAVDLGEVERRNPTNDEPVDEPDKLDFRPADWQTRQMLAQIMPTANIRQLEERRAWIAGEVSLTQQVRDTLVKLQGLAYTSIEFDNVIEELVELAGVREES